MTTLKKWKIIKYGDDYVLEGVVYGHYRKRCYDGRSIITSIIESAEVKENELIVHTMNTEYHLSYSEFSNFQHYANDEFLTRFATEMCKKDAEELINYIMNAAESNMETFLNVADKKLSDNMLYLEVTTDFLYKCNFAVYKTSNGNVNLTSVCNNLFCNEVIISDVSGECSVRYTEDFDYIKFHNTLFAAIPDEKLCNPDGTTLGYIKNIGSEVINIYFSWGKIIDIEPDTDIEVVYGMGEVYDVDKFEWLS